MNKLFITLILILSSGCGLLFKKENTLNFGATSENIIDGDNRTLGPIQKYSESLDDVTLVSIAAAGALPTKTVSVRGQLKCLETFMNQPILNPLKNRKVKWRIDRGPNLTEIKGESVSDHKGYFFIDFKGIKTEYFENLDIEITVGEYSKSIQYQKFYEALVLNELDCNLAKSNK